ncbi:MAG: EamA family transporter [Thermoleophilia bacterium]
MKGLRRRLSTVHLMLYTTLVTSVALFVLSLATRESLVPRTLRGFLIVLTLAWVSQVLGQGLIAYGMAHVPVSFSSVSLLLQPVAAALLAWAVLAESVGWWQAFGGAGVLAGVVVARAGSSQSPAARTKGVRPV